MSSQRHCSDKIYLIAIEARCRAEGIVPTDVHMEKLIELREKLGKDTKETHEDQTDLALKLNPKTSIFPYTHGIDFCGYRIWPTHILPRKRNVKRARKRLQKLVKLYRDRHISFKRVKSSIMSFIGYMKHCNGYKSLSCILSETKLTL